MMNGNAFPTLRSSRPSRLVLDDMDGINRGLLGWWPLDEAGGTLADDISPWRGRGTVTGAPSRAVGLKGRMTNFNGSSQYISTTRRQTLFGFSAVARIKPDFYSSYNHCIISSLGGNGVLWQVSDYAREISLWANTGVNPATISITQILDREVVIGVSWRPGRATRFFVDGVFVGQANTSGDVVAANTGWEIGRWNTSRYFHGRISGLRVWSRVLADQEFARLYTDMNVGAVAPEDRLFFALRGAGGTTYNDTITDALTAADSLLCAITFGADLADSWTLAESAAAAVTFEVAIADSAFPGDIFGSGFEAVVTFTATLDEAATLGESFVGGLLLSAVFSDAITAADSLAYTLVFSVAIADSVYPGDIGDPSVAAVSFAAAVSDSASLGESFIGGFVYTSAISDGWTVGDSLDDSLTLFAQAAFTMLQVTVVVGRIELVSGGPDATFTNLTEQQSRV